MAFTKPSSAPQFLNGVVAVGLEQTLLNASFLSGSFVHRSRIWEKVLPFLLDKDKKTKPNIVVLWGAGGYGKTTLAIKICREMQNRGAFPDGIIWVQLDKEPKATSSDFQEAARRLGGFGDSHILIVIDDLQDQKQVWDFIDFDSPNVAWLITTGNWNAIPNIVPKERRVKIKEMKRIEAIDLLVTEIKGGSDNCLKRREGRVQVKQWGLSSLAEQLGKWPLILKMANSSLVDRVDHDAPLPVAIKSLEEDLRENGLLAFDDELAIIIATLETSLNRLGEGDRARFRELAVFPEGISIPLTTVEQFWLQTAGLSRQATEKLCLRLDKQSLLRKFSLDPNKAGIQLHNEIRKYLTSQQEDNLIALADELLNSHPNNQDWAAMPEDEPYFWNHLAFHLRQAERGSELVETVKHWRWLATKTRKRKAIAVEDDLDKAINIAPGDEVLRNVQRAFANADQWLKGATDDEIEAQLFARLQHLKNRLTEMPQDLVGKITTPYMAVRFDFPDPFIERDADPVQSCSFNLDHRQMVSVSSHGAIQVWDMQTGRRLRAIEGHSEKVNDCGLSPDGRRIVLASDDRSLIVRDIESGELLYTLKEHSAPVNGCAFSRDGSRIVSASSDHTLILWDVQGGSVLRRFERDADYAENEFGYLVETEVRIDGHEDAVNDCAFSSDGKLIVSASDDGTLKIWDVESGTVWHTLRGHSNFVNRCAFSNNDELIVSASSDHKLGIWDVQTGRRRLELGGEDDFVQSHQGTVNDCAFSTDDQLIVSASSDGTLRIWDIASGQCLTTFYDDGEMYCCLIDGEMIVGGGARGVYFLMLVR